VTASPSHLDPKPAWRAEHGDTLWAPEREILRTVVGSGVHGIAIPGTDDHDEMGVYVEPAEAVIGLSTGEGHYIARTQPEGARSEHGDTDRSLYALRKYLALVIAGNPTVLLPLFAPESDVLVCTDLGRKLRSFGPTLLSQQAGWRFLGYLNAQRDRVLGVDRRHLPQRPELVAKYGYDTKYACHALRLGIQGIEVATWGRLTLPMAEEDRDVVLTVKRGEVDRETAIEWINLRAEALAELLRAGKSPLPEKPDYAAASRWLVSAHFTYWGQE
jgi:hypothetical protein